MNAVIFNTGANRKKFVTSKLHDVHTQKNYHFGKLNFFSHENHEALNYQIFCNELLSKITMSNCIRFYCLTFFCFLCELHAVKLLLFAVHRMYQ